MLQRRKSVAVIGAGVTGLALAERLVQSGRSVTVFDKGRGLGGRIATRRTPYGLFDHGAPRFDATHNDFRRFLGNLNVMGDARGRYVGLPGMRNMFDTFKEAVEIMQPVRIVHIEKQPEGWALKSDAGQRFAHFDDLILTIPAPQAAELACLVDPELARDAGSVPMLPVWTCMVQFDRPLDSFGIPEGGPILAADRMGDKPGREDARSAWVIHMTPDYTREFLNADRAVLAPTLLSAFADACGLDLPGIVYLNAHRWRYAFAERALGKPYLVSDKTGLVVGGDWTLGRRAEDGFDSAVAMADFILSEQAVTV